MSKRNVAWLIVIVAVCVLVWINVGALWGLLAGGGDARRQRVGGTRRPQATQSRSR